MLKHTDISKETLLHLIRKRQVTMAGNRKLKIYGTLKCSSGKRMKKENRLFFANANEAIQAGFRPCGHCLKGEYQRWKVGICLGFGFCDLAFNSEIRKKQVEDANTYDKL